MHDGGNTKTESTLADQGRRDIDDRHRNQEPDRFPDKRDSAAERQNRPVQAANRRQQEGHQAPGQNDCRSAAEERLVAERGCQHAGAGINSSQ